MDKIKKKAIIDKVKINEKDCGSAEVQIAVLTERIKEISGHLDTHKKDQHSRRGLLLMVGRRRRLMKYLSGDNPKRYAALSEKIGIK